MQTPTVGVYNLTATCSVDLIASDIVFPFCNSYVAGQAPQYIIPAVQTFVCDNLEAAVLPSLQDWIAPGRVRTRCDSEVRTHDHDVSV